MISHEVPRPEDRAEWRPMAAFIFQYSSRSYWLRLCRLFVSARRGVDGEVGAGNESVLKYRLPERYIEEFQAQQMRSGGTFYLQGNNAGAFSER
jgi:hypothetical protein